MTLFPQPVEPLPLTTNPDHFRLAENGVIPDAPHWLPKYVTCVVPLFRHNSHLSVTLNPFPLADTVVWVSFRMSTGHGSQVGERHDSPLRLGYDLFDREPDPALDELTSLTAVLCGADYAYAGWMDARRLWFKSQYGFKAPDQPRTLGPCQWVVDKGEPMLIRDSSKDKRFPPEGIPLIGGPAAPTREPR